MSQTEAIKSALQAGDKLTALDIQSRFQCMRAAARIEEIRKMGLPVQTVMVKVPSGKRVAQYQL